MNELLSGAEVKSIAVSVHSVTLVFDGREEIYYPRSHSELELRILLRNLCAAIGEWERTDVGVPSEVLDIAAKARQKLEERP